MFNVLICGTPGTGKSKIVEKIKKELPSFQFINVSRYAIENDLIGEYDVELASQVLKEDVLIDKLLDLMKKQGLNFIESIHADLFEDHEIDVVFVIRAKTEVLYDRLKKRNYSDAKIENNMQAEIFQVIFDEVKETFDESKVHELQNNNLSDLDHNINCIVKTIFEQSKDLRKN